MLLKLNMYSCESMNMIEKLNQEHDLALSENVESKKEYNKIFDMIWDCLYKYGFIMRYPLDPNEEHLKILIKDYEKIQEENKQLKEENDNCEADDDNLTKVMSRVSNELCDEEEPHQFGVDDIYDIVRKLKQEIMKQKEINELQSKLIEMSSSDDV